MKRKILISLILSILLITGCGNSTNDNKNEGQVQDKLEAKVENLTISLDSTGSFNDISYKYPSKATTGNVGLYNIMDYMNDKELVFRVVMYYFENKSLDDAMTITSNKTKTINGIEWHIYDDKTEDGKDLTTYAYYNNKGTYSIGFIHDKDINNFIDVFMNTVKFK